MRDFDKIGAAGYVQNSNCSLEYEIWNLAPPTVSAVTSDHSPRAKSSMIWIAIVTDKIKKCWKNIK